MNYTRLVNVNDRNNCEFTRVDTGLPTKSQQRTQVNYTVGASEIIEGTIERVP